MVEHSEANIGAIAEKLAVQDAYLNFGKILCVQEQVVAWKKKQSRYFAKIPKAVPEL